jgi:hypothetical protein
VIDRLRPGDRFAASVSEVQLNGAQASGTQAGEVRDILIVSLGDSVASGEGNRRFRPPRWADAECHRSFFAGPRIAAEMIARRHPHALLTFVHAACTGAWIDGKGAPSFLDDRPSVLPTTHNEGEVDAVLGLIHDRRPDAILLSVGANDLGFSGIVRHCFFTTTCWEKKWHKERLPGLIRRRLRALRRSFVRLAKDPLLTRSRGVYLTEYFDPLQDRPGHYCTIRALRGLFVISPKEAEWAEKKVIDPLNALLRKAAHKAHWTYVDGIQREFQHHGYCAKRKNRWVVQLWPSAVRAQLMGTLHPNRAGQQFYAKKILEFVEPNLGSAG